MNSTTAYQIGAVFFLAVLFMVGTLTRGLVPIGIFKNAKLVMLVTGALLVGWMAYLRFPGLSGVFDSEAVRPAPPVEATPSSKPRHASTDSGVPAPPPLRSAARPGPAVQPALQPAPAVQIRETPVVQAAPAVAAPQPQQIPESQIRVTTPAPSPPVARSAEFASAPVQRDDGNRVTRAMKSVGHFLHIGHDKYRPPSVAPVPAADPQAGNTQTP